MRCRQQANIFRIVRHMDRHEPCRLRAVVEKLLEDRGIAGMQRQSQRLVFRVAVTPGVGIAAIGQRRLYARQVAGANGGPQFVIVQGLLEIVRARRGRASPAQFKPGAAGAACCFGAGTEGASCLAKALITVLSEAAPPDWPRSVLMVSPELGSL